MLADGRIVASGTPAELRAGVTGTAAVPAGPAARRRTRWPPWSGRSPASDPGPPSSADGDGGRYRLEGVAPDAALVAALAAWCATARTG